MNEKNETTADQFPDRLSTNPNSPYYNEELLSRDVGIRFKGAEKTNVEEYCISEGWIRVTAGNAKDRYGNPLTIKVHGPVEPYFRDSDCTNLDPDKVWSTLMSNEKPGGHGERSVAVGTIDMAVWDAVAKIAGQPLFRLLAERHGLNPNPRVFVYAAGGYYYPGKDLSALRGEMRGYLDRGYNVVKMKIGGAPLSEDRMRIEAVLEEIGSEARLAVDANGRFDLETAIAYAKMLRDYPLFWYEEAGDPLDFALQAALAEFYPAAMATGENLFSHQDARNLIRYGGMRPDRDWLQFDCALSYGLCEYQRTLAMLKTQGWSASRCIPHGGHQMSLNIAAGLGLGGNESYPDLFQPYGGFPDGVRVENGHITMPDLPGIGFEGKSDLYKEMKALAA